MKRILFISSTDIAKRGGVGLATLAYYNAVCEMYPGIVDLMMPLEACNGKYSNAIGVPSRSRLKAVLSGSMHRYKAFLRNYLKNHREQYFLCIINGGLYGDTVNMIHHYGLKVMVIHHNFEREYCMDNKTIYTLWGRTSIFVNRLEKKAYKCSECNCFLTPEDLSLLQIHYGKTNGKSVLLGVFEPEIWTPTPPKNTSKNRIVITGSMNTYQTICGIIDVANNYYGIIKKVCPDWELVIAGRNPRQEVYEFQKQDNACIRVIPNPVVMDDITQSASIFLCPTNVGGGLKLRVMDGLRQGLPVLVHKVSARGYNKFYDKPYFQIYYDKKTFIEGLSKLVQYVNSGHDGSIIQRDYMSFWGFERGCEIMKNTIDSLY